MAYGAFQTAVSRTPIATNGQVISPASADVAQMLVETSDGIGLGVLVSRGTDPEKQIVVGVDDIPLGFTVRAGDVAGALGSEATNTPIYEQYEVAPVIRDGEFDAYISGGAATAGSTEISVVDATGVLQLGAASEAGESDITGLTLERTMTAEGIARFTLDKATFAVTAYSAT